MPSKDKRIYSYISKSQPFARPVLNHLRKLVHAACPEVSETIKWGFPHFEYKGILCSMASFKSHCTFGFWKGAVMKDPEGIISRMGNTAMGHFGRIAGMEDLPSDRVIKSYIAEAVRLNEEGVQPVVAKKKKSAIRVPSYFAASLSKNKKAKEVFYGFSYSHRKEYVEWIKEAKTEETRSRRIRTALEWLSKGKVKEWKYVEK